jgi:Fur family iron response transcriptional regulator
MSGERPYAELLQRLRAVGLRPTRQRLALARLLFEKGDRHVTADELHLEAEQAGIGVSLATIYNTLNQFTHAGLLRAVAVEAGRAYFDTNTSDHHHFFFEDGGKLADIPAEGLSVAGVPAGPKGTAVARVDVIVRLRRS